MAIIKHGGQDPWRSLEPLRNEINRLFDWSTDLFPRLRADVFAPTADMWEDKESVHVEVELPGFDKKDVDVTLRDGGLVVSAQREEVKEEKERDYRRSERYRGRYYREIDLPSSADAGKADAQFKNGVLAVTIPKKEEAKAKEVKVKLQ